MDNKYTMNNTIDDLNTNIDDIDISMLSDEILEKLYRDAHSLDTDITNEDNTNAVPYRYSRELGIWIVPGMCVPYAYSTHLTDILDEYVYTAGLCYHYCLMNDEEHNDNQIASESIIDPTKDIPNTSIVTSAKDLSATQIMHTHSFDNLVATLIRHPQTFRIPINCLDDYSRQEIALLCEVQKKLTTNNG